jgi:hypothetical protein
MFAAQKIVSVAALAFLVTACNLDQLAGQQITTTSSTNVNEIQLQLQPESAWTANFGTINPVCAGGPNPRETAFTTVGSGVSMSAASNTADCCTCAARSHAIPVAKSSTLGAHLRGTAIFERGQYDTYAQASIRLTLKNGGQVVGERIVESEIRANDNCIGSSEKGIDLAQPSGEFDVDLEAAAPGAMFDEIDVDLNGYACGTATTSVTLEEMRLAFVSGGSAPAPTPAPTPTPAPAASGTPDLSSAVTPSQWSAYASGTIGEDNSGIATIENHGTGVAKGVTVDIHTESNNPYGPVAPFRSMDARCIASNANRNAYTCMLGDLAPGASTNIAFTFNSFDNTTVVVIAKDTNGDVDFSDNRVVGHVY